MKCYEKVKETLRDELEWYITMKKSQQKLIGKIEAARRSAVSNGNDDIALAHTNQLVQLRKDYEYLEGRIDGAKHALRLFERCEEGIDVIIDEEGEVHEQGNL